MVSVADGVDGSAPPMFEVGSWLVERHSSMEANESAWLDVLVDFDKDEGWAADGQLHCAAWLTWRLGMARSTAYEKLRLARELSRRTRSPRRRRARLTCLQLQTMRPAPVSIP